MTLEGFSQPAEVEDEQTFLIRKEIIQASQAEHAIVRCVLLDNSLYASAGVSYTLFQSASLRKIYSATGEMIGDQRPADVVTVSEHLQAKEPHIDWLAVLVDVVRNSWGEPDQIEEYCSILKESYAKRTARDIANRLLEGITKDIGAVDIAVRDLMQLNQTDRRYEHSSGDMLKAAINNIQTAFDKAQKGEIVGISTGLKDLDEKLGGFHDTDLTAILARPAMAKTSLLLNLAEGCMLPFGVISCEQENAQIGMRMISIAGNVSGNRMRKGTLREEDWPKVTAGVNILRGKQFWINDDPTINIDQIASQARKWKYTNGIRILFVDYLQRIYPTDKRMTSIQKVESTVLGLKSLAKELGIPIVALGQVNRECEKRPDKRPMVSDAADASIIDKECDMIWTLYRDEVYNEDTPDKGIAEIAVAKNRHGPTGVIRTAWRGEYFKFSDLSIQHYRD